jgi:eukaryotic-like serine/threonine-protein kinase
VNERDKGASTDESHTNVEQLPHEHVDVTPIRPRHCPRPTMDGRTVAGEGGMGIVVRAHDRTLGVTVALKIVRAELAGERSWAERLAREVKLARQIHHPNVCRVFELGQDGGRVFLVMEAGRARHAARRVAGAFRDRPLADRLADARAVAGGLVAIHAAGIVHRDVSPQNLLRMSDGRLVVSDFGLATDAAETTTSIHGGTLAYMDPELVRGGGRASVASDVWALGVVIHELVFGEKLMWRQPAGSEMRPPLLGRPLTASEEAAFEVCRGCTATEPTRRLRTTGEVAQMLGEGTKPKLRLRAHVSPRRLLAIAASVIATSAAVGAIVVKARRSQPADVVASAERSPLIVATGEPADWTEKSMVLARCLSASTAPVSSPPAEPSASPGASRAAPRTSTQRPGVASRHRSFRKPTPRAARMSRPTASAWSSPGTLRTSAPSRSSPSKRTGARPSPSYRSPYPR